MIFFKANAGLCNKLLAISSALHFANVIGTRLHVLWVTDMHMSDLFTDLFEPVSVFSLHQLRVPNMRICRAVANRILPRLFDEPSGIDAILAREESFIAACKKKPNRIWRFASFREFYPAEDFSWLKPRPEIMGRIAEFKGLTNGGVVGVHIRRGDHVQAMRCSPLELFYQKIMQEISVNHSARFLLCTDDPQVKNDMRVKFPDNVFTRDFVLARKEKGGIADAVVDLWLLSQCQKIYGTYPSSFSLVASRIGKTEFEWVRNKNEVA